MLFRLSRQLSKAAFIEKSVPRMPFTRAFSMETPTLVGKPEQKPFQAETRRLLDIVANSLYSEKEIFARELLSNASDALEKSRFLALTQKQSQTDSSSPLQIKISTLKESNQLVIQDNGIGMTLEQINENLGTIALSGSKKFTAENGTKDKIIGQFGVGFYSLFMIGSQVEVYSKAAGSSGCYWKSDGLGHFESCLAENVEQGTKIIIQVKPEETRFLDQSVLKSLIKKYSNFVSFPIFLNNVQVNEIQPLWTKEKSKISDSEFSEFYKFIANDQLDPMFKLSYSVDCPVQIQSLFFIPKTNQERFGLKRQDSGLNLYCKKVLIKQQTKELLPDWLRFVRGVVDSQDIPLNLSREILQDSAQISKIKKILVGRIIKWLEDEAKSDPEKYMEFYNEFGVFLKEGIFVDQEFKKDIANLLRFDSSESEKKVSLKEYCQGENKEIVYLHAANRSSALASPYLEPFLEKKIPVLFVYEQIDPFLMDSLGEFNGKPIESAENAGARLGSEKKEITLEQESLLSFFKDTLGLTVVSVEPSRRKISAPTLIVDHQPANILKMIKAFNNNPDLAGLVPPQKLEINLEHPLILGLMQKKDQDHELCKLLIQQLYDNAMISAGLIEDPRSIVPRMTELLNRLIK